MRITINYTSALRQRAGVGRYTRNLVAALAEVDRANSYTLFSTNGEKAAGTWPANFWAKTTPLTERTLTAAWHKVGLPIPAELLSGPADIFHSPDFTLPPLRSARGVVTVHDLSFLRVPQCADPGLREHLVQHVPRAVRRARRVLADSEHTRRDLIELLGVDPWKVLVVYGGVESRFRRVTDQEQLKAVRARYQLPEWFVLFVGTIEPRKNLSRLIAAYKMMRREFALPHRLIISGSLGWLYEEILEQVKQERLEDSVRFLGFVADEDLPAVYSLSSLFVFPSLYEGFGLPPLEAMACGVPVVASNNSSLPEVLGPAALLVDPKDTEGLAATMRRVLVEEALQEELAAKGPAQAAQFTWEMAARQLMQAYEMVMHA